MGSYVKFRQSPVCCVALCLLLFFPLAAGAQQTELVFTAPPQAFLNSCQSYSIAVAMGYVPSAPYKAETPQELRDLEQRVYAKLKQIAESKNTEIGKLPATDLAASIEFVTSNALTLVSKQFAHLDDAMRFIATETGISDPAGLGATLSVTLVKKPVLLSFSKVKASSYASGHVVSVFGVQLPPTTMGDSAKPKLLLLNSAVKYAGGVKNACEFNDFPGPQSPGDKKYSAVLTLTDDYTLRFTGPFYVNRVMKN